MKVEINEKGKTKAKEFPKLMIGTLGTIVLMVSYGVGFAIDSNKKTDSKFKEIGSFHDKWQMEFFKDFEGSITLSND